MSENDVVKTVGTLLSGLLAGGGASSIAGAVDKGLALILQLTKDDPVKRAKVLRQYQDEMWKIIEESPDAKNKDVTDLVITFNKLLDAE